MNPKEATPIQHQIELAVTSGMGYTDKLYFDQMTGRQLKHEDDADLQFDLAYQALRGALTIGRKDLCSQLYRECWQLIYLRRRLAYSHPAVFVATPSQVTAAIKINTSTTGEPVYDYQLPAIMAGISSPVTPHTELSDADLAILRAGQNQPLPSTVNPILFYLFEPKKIIDGYVDAIEGDTQYLDTF